MHEKNGNNNDDDRNDDDECTQVKYAVQNFNRS